LKCNIEYKLLNTIDIVCYLPFFTLIEGKSSFNCAKAE